MPGPLDRLRWANLTGQRTRDFRLCLLVTWGTFIISTLVGAVALNP